MGPVVDCRAGPAFLLSSWPCAHVAHVMAATSKDWVNGCHRGCLWPRSRGRRDRATDSTARWVKRCPGQPSIFACNISRCSISQSEAESFAKSHTVARSKSLANAEFSALAKSCSRSPRTHRVKRDEVHQRQRELHLQRQIRQYESLDQWRRHHSDSQAVDAHRRDRHFQDRFS